MEIKVDKNKEKREMDKHTGSNGSSSSSHTEVPMRNKLKRNVGLQTYIYHKEYIKPSLAVTHNLDVVEYSRLWAVPHSVSYIIILSLLLYTYGDMSEGSIEITSRKGIFAVVGCMVTFGCLYLPDSVLKRPHPVLWRFFQSLGILYLLFLVFLLFQSLDTARVVMKYLDPELGQPLKEKAYADDCGLTKPEFPFINFDAIEVSIDFYMLIHFAGWVFKMIYIRDVYICWFLSVTWEVVELSLRHWLNNFYECWWDSLILDIFFCNALGIYFGSLICTYFENESHNKTSWINRKYNKTNLLFYIKYFVPNTWVKHQWNTFTSFKGFMSTLWLIAILHLVDLSNFMLKFIIWIPPSHTILLVRIFIWAGLCAMAIREYYEYVTSKSIIRFGQAAWLAHVILFTEYAIIFKFSKGMFTEVTPMWVILFWTALGVTCVVFALNLLINEFKNVKGNSQKVNSNSIELPMDIEYVDDSSQCNLE